MRAAAACVCFAEAPPSVAPSAAGPEVLSGCGLSGRCRRWRWFCGPASAAAAAALFQVSPLAPPPAGGAPPTCPVSDPCGHTCSGTERSWTHQNPDLSRVQRRFYPGEKKRMLGVDVGVAADRRRSCEGHVKVNARSRPLLPRRRRGLQQPAGL
ncbi:hypothetical protein D4764_18G0012370 [Takifugu flavidus]|uniref:Uncharacterized protein n=1 Tax=Takifugu flavidus TaxID=433684 RepID=A0A5C6NV42_9TELE|nr:hypothetical protein D4764_18G0012370 [Takifugu flavidus]